MYCISSETDKPDIAYMKNKADELMKRGIRLRDCAPLLEHYTKLSELLKTDLNNKYAIANPNSSQQITAYIQKMSNSIDISSKNDIINICYNDKTRKWTSNKDAMSKLADLGYEFAQDLLDYRHAKKYAEAISSLQERADANNIIHPEVTLGKTNRINYSNPALMNIPKQMLWHLVAPFNTGDVIYSADIKNQEPVIMINMTDSDELKPALESKDGLYETLFKQCFEPTATANVIVDMLPENRLYKLAELKSMPTVSPAYYSAVQPKLKDVFYNDCRVVGIETICTGSTKGFIPELPSVVSIETEDGNIHDIAVTWDDTTKNKNKTSDYKVNGKLSGLEVRVTKQGRKEFKTAWNAITYGASEFGVRNMCKTIDGNQVYNFISKVAGFKNYRSQVDKLAKSGASTIGTFFGTRLSAGDTYDYMQLKRTLLDLPIQGTAADILSLLIKHFYSYTESKGLSNVLDIYYTRHDELIIEANGEWVESTGKDNVEAILRDMIEHKVDNWTPFHVDIAIKSNTSLNLDKDEEAEIFEEDQ